MSNIAIFHISVALNINFNHVKGIRDGKVSRKVLFKGVYTKLRCEILLLRLSTTFSSAFSFLRMNKNSKNVLSSAKKPRIFL